MDMAIVYDWNPGSLPPPAYYELRLSLDDTGTGNIEVRPDYAFNNPPIWTWDFIISSDEAKRLMNAIAQESASDVSPQMSEPSVGGPQESTSLALDGTTRDVALPSPVIEQLKSAVPESIWDEIDARRATYARRD